MLELTSYFEESIQCRRRETVTNLTPAGTGHAELNGDRMLENFEIRRKLSRNAIRFEFFKNDRNVVTFTSIIAYS